MKQFDMSTLAPDVFDVELPTLGKKVVMRPFIMKEYKTLMIAKEGGDPNTAIMNALNRCVVEGDGVDFTTMPVSDAEMVFLQLYMSSTGNNNIPITYLCKNEVGEEGDEHPCGTQINANISIEHAYVPKTDILDIFKVNGNVSVKMRQPSLPELTKGDLKTPEGLFGLVLSCIDSIIVGEEVYTKEDLGEEQLEQIIDMVPGTLFATIANFVTEAPRVTTMVDIQCPSCGHTEQVILEGINDFFV